MWIGKGVKFTLDSQNHRFRSTIRVPGGADPAAALLRSQRQFNFADYFFLQFGHQY
jgi:hypothetical protein